MRKARARAHTRTEPGEHDDDDDKRTERGGRDGRRIATEDKTQDGRRGRVRNVVVEAAAAAVTVVGCSGG